MRDPGEEQADPQNPYAAPAASHPVDEESSVEDEALRRRLLKYETFFQTIGTVFGVAAVLFVAGAFQLLTEGGGIAPSAIPLLTHLSLASICGIVAWGLQTLQPWVRVALISLSLPALIVFPIGTTAAAVFLVTMFSWQTRTVLSAEYRRVVRRTPHVRSGIPLPAFFVAGVGLILLLLNMLRLLR